MPVHTIDAGTPLTTSVVSALDALRFTTPTNLSSQPQAFEMAVEQLVPQGLVERHGAWRFTLTSAGIQSLLEAKVEVLFSQVAEAAAKQRAQGTIAAAQPPGMWTDRLVSLVRWDWRGAANKAAGTTPDQCLFKAACLALLALMHEGASLEELRPRWVAEVDALRRGEKHDAPTTRPPIDWAMRASFACCLWRVTSVDFTTAMLRTSALAFLGWFHLRRTRWSLPAGHGSPPRRRRSRAART